MAKNVNSKFNVADGFDFGITEQTSTSSESPNENIKKEVAQVIKEEQTVKNPPNTTILGTEMLIPDVPMPSDPYARQNLHRQLGSTQGKKGEALKKTTMRLSDDNDEYLERRSRQLGLSRTQFVNMLIEQDRMKTQQINTSEI